MFQTYLKIAFRNLRNNLTYTLINVSGLAAGLAGAVLIFLFLQFHYSTDRHQPHFDRIYRVVLNLLLDEGTEYMSDSSVPLAGALARDYSQVEEVGFVRRIPDATFSSAQGHAVRRFREKDNVVFADQGFMEMFAFDWLENNASASMKAPYNVVISEKVALKYFGASDVVGKILRFDNTNDLKITGVMRDNSKPTDLGFDIYISLPTLKKVEPSFEMDNFGWLSTRNLSFVRLTPDAVAEQTEKLIKTNGTKYYAETAKYYDHHLQPLSEVHFDERYDGKIRRSILWILAGVGIFLLCIACINFVNLATAQAIKRAKEIGVRKVLGSTRQQLFWQFISETALLVIASALISLVIVAIFLPFMNNWMHTRSFHLSMLFQWTLAMFWLATIPVVVMVAGFYPAIIISGFNPVSALKSKLGTSQIGGLGVRRVLIAFQLVISQVLVIGTLVLILQLKFFRSADLGFDQNAVLTIPLPKADPTLKLKHAFRDELLQRTDIKSVAYQYEAPTSTMGFGGSVRFDNRVEWEKFVIRERFGDENYIDTYKMPLLAGRNFYVKDSLTEFVVNEELMRRLGIRDPEKMIGRQLEDGNTGFKGTIVGVVQSFHLKSLQNAIEPCAIFARPSHYKEVAVKLNTKDLPETLKNIQKIWLETYPDEVFSYQFVDDQIASFYEKEQQLTSLIRTFAFVAIFICCLGLFGMISFMVTQKTKEIGVRKVLGAGVDQIVFLLGKEFLLLVIVAFIVASPLTWLLTKNWLSGFAYRIELQWWIFGSGGFTILLISLCTVGAKVVHAAMANPVKSLRSE